jgi:hypothetical protein
VTDVAPGIYHSICESVLRNLTFNMDCLRVVDYETAVIGLLGSRRPYLRTMIDRFTFHIL